MKEWIFEEAIKLLHEGDKAKAAQILAKYIKRYPEDVNAWLMLSDALDDPKRVEFALNKALEIDPTNSFALKKYNQIITNAPQRSTYYNSPFIDLDTKIDPQKSESFVYIPEYEQDDDINQTETQKTLTSIEKKHQAIVKSEEKKQVDENEDEKSNRFLGIFFITLMVIAALVTIYVTKVFWVSPIASVFSEDIQIYLEAFKNNKNPLTLLEDFQVAATEVYVFQHPTPTPVITPTALPTYTANEISAHQIAEEINQIKLQSDGLNFGIKIITEEAAEQILNQNQLPVMQIEAQEQSLIALGLIEEDFDYQDYLTNSQVAPQVFFSNYDQILYATKALENSQIKYEFSYAFTKWLQSFGVMKQPEATSYQNSDQEKASLAFYNGDAYFTQKLYMNSLSPSEQNQIKTPNTTYTMWSIPPAIFYDSIFEIEYGQEFIQSVYDQSGMIGVQSLYSNPPQTTEQIIHPEKYFAHELGTFIPMQDLTNMLGIEWQLVETNSLGEWGTYQILAHGARSYASIDEIFAQNASYGWGGDSYQVFVNEDGTQYILVAHWIMDTDIDGTELANNLNQVNRSRFSRGTTIISENTCHTQDNQISCVFNADKQVLWIIAPQEDQISSILDRYPAIK